MEINVSQKSFVSPRARATPTQKWLSLVSGAFVAVGALLLTLFSVLCMEGVLKTYSSSLHTALLPGVFGLLLTSWAWMLSPWRKRFSEWSNVTSLRAKLSVPLLLAHVVVCGVVIRSFQLVLLLFKESGKEAPSMSVLQSDIHGYVSANLSIRYLITLAITAVLGLLIAYLLWRFSNRSYGLHTDDLLKGGNPAPDAKGSLYLVPKGVTALFFTGSVLGLFVAFVAAVTYDTWSKQ